MISMVRTCCAWASKTEITVGYQKLNISIEYQGGYMYQ